MSGGRAASKRAGAWLLAAVVLMLPTAVAAAATRTAEPAPTAVATEAGPTAGPAAPDDAVAAVTAPVDPAADTGASAPVEATATATTEPAPPVDLVAATDWLAGPYYSPCDGTTVEVTDGGAPTVNGFISVNGVVTLDGLAGRALVFLNCRNAGGDLIGSVAQLITVGPDGTRTTFAQQGLAGGSRLMSVSPTELVLEAAVGTPPDGGCCAPYVRRQTIGVGIDRFTVSNGAVVPAFHRALDGVSGGGENVSLVTGRIPPLAACYRWGNTALRLTAPNPTGAIVHPDAELSTMRLALIHLTGRWIEPAPYMNADMDAAARAFQSANGLAADGIIGNQTKTAVRDVLGCPPTQGFTAVDPVSVGPRTFNSPAELAAAAARYASEGGSGNPALDELLWLSRWDGTNAFFLGCERRQNPSNGVTCSWSGATPLQLVGLATDVDDGPVTGLSILYARTAAPA